MTLLQQIERIRYIHYLISSHSTGAPDNFAEKLNLSRRQMYNLLEELKDIGLDIAYSRIRRTFYYRYPVELKIEIKMEQLKNEICEKTFGGTNLTTFSDMRCLRAVKLHGRVATL